MKVVIADYNPQWDMDFTALKEKIAVILEELNPIIEHVGSTSIKGLGAKPIIDILIGVQNETDLEKLRVKMMDHGFTYYRIYNEVMPERRLLVKLDHNEYLNPPLIL